MYKAELYDRNSPIHNKKVSVLKGRPLPDVPKTWKKIGYIHVEKYPTAIIKLYEAKDKTLRWSRFVDGCFYEFHGKVELEN